MSAFQALKLRKGARENDYLYLYTRNLLYVEVCIAPIFGPFLCYGQVIKSNVNNIAFLWRFYMSTFQI